MSDPAKTLTGRVRRRKTTLRVKVSEVLARIFITAAGLGTILAIVTVCFFLVSVVLPLFQPGRVEEGPHFQVDAALRGAAPVRTDTDEYGVVGWNYYADGRLVVFRMADGRVLKTVDLFEGAAPTCQSFLLRGGDAIFGFADGTIRLASISFTTRFLDFSDVEPRHRQLKVGESMDLGGGVVELTPLGQFRLQEVAVTVGDPVKLSDAALRRVDLIRLSSGPSFVAIDETQTLFVNEVRETRNLLTGKTTVRLSGGTLALTKEMTGGRGLADWLLFEGRGDSVTLVWADGFAARFDSRLTGEIRFAEQTRLVPEGSRITVLEFMIGRMTMVVGEASGRVTTWFRVKPTGALQTRDGSTVVVRRAMHPPVASHLRPLKTGELPPEIQIEEDLLVVPTSDASVLVEQHELSPGQGVAVSALGISKRRRTVMVGYEDGHAEMFHVTSDRRLAKADVFPTGTPIQSISMGPKEDFVIFAGPNELARWDLRIPHPQTTLAAIFTRVWYEGFERPEHVWQSTSGTDEFEPKYGLIPLIFGTLKATLYTMLFGAPLALLAAVYSSEFLHARTKARIKPTIEIMASLPSVVLGFLAAIVFAPFIERVVPQVLASAFTIPFMLLLGAFLWQLLPGLLLGRLRALRFAAMFLMLPLGMALGALLGPLVQTLLFGGDLKAWLAWAPNPADPAANAASPYRDGAGGWMLLLLPLSALAATFFCVRFVNPIVASRFHGGSRASMALAHLVKFLIGTAVTVAIALTISSFLSFLGFDPRGTIVGTYIQRNAMIVGFVMGFAVIPIIYTLAEDALSAVPEHLRAGALGAGATRWQTAITIIIPTAMSGLFSALMIGLGRAVGETMIVLMAAGNTPILEWNIFSGFRTLSANIAVELPEAVQNSTNYRMLFLAALTLFAMTFVVNTVAEVVRLRFRKRAYAL